MKFEELAKTFTLKNLPESEVELTGEVPYDTLAPYRTQALAHIAEHLEMPGFRPGKVPTDVALKKVGEVGVLEEAAELFIKDFYPELVESLKLDAVGRPEIKITKLAPGNPAGFVIRTGLYPEVAVPKNWKFLYEKIVLETALPATQEEVDKTLKDLYKSRHPDRSPDAPAEPEVGVPTEASGLTDEFAKSLGAFDSLVHLKEQITKGITEEKQRQAKDTRRGRLIEQLVEMTPLSVPRVFIESELDKIIAQMREDVSRFGMSYEDYLKRVNKTEDAIRGEFREQALKRAKLQLILNKLALEEDIKVDEAAVASEMKHALEHFPDANPELLRIHIETVMRNEQVLKLLEGGAQKE